jgi:hypothetical protein
MGLYKSHSHAHFWKVADSPHLLSCRAPFSAQKKKQCPSRVHRNIRVQTGVDCRVYCFVDWSRQGYPDWRAAATSASRAADCALACGMIGLDRSSPDQLKWARAALSYKQFLHMGILTISAFRPASTVEHMPLGTGAAQVAQTGEQQLPLQVGQPFVCSACGMVG